MTPTHNNNTATTTTAATSTTSRAAAATATAYNRVSTRIDNDDGTAAVVEPESTRRVAPLAARLLSAVTPASTTSTRRPRRRPYNRLAGNGDDDDDDGDDEQQHDEEARTDADAAAAPTQCSTSTVSDDSAGLNHSNSNTTDEDGDDWKENGDDEIDAEDRLEVIILDFKQQRFPIKASKAWTVEHFKFISSKTHKVPVPLQRLVFSGKLLQDTKTLQESGITQNGVIVHLFPKPRVIVHNSNNNTSCTTADSSISADSNDANAGGAHVPTIVLDANEMEQRAHILVLGSAEYIEAQNNVKLFSFMLLIISSIELLNLLAIALGVPQDDNYTTGSGASSSNGYAGSPFETDDIFPPSSFDNNNGNDDYYLNLTDSTTDPSSLASSAPFSSGSTDDDGFGSYSRDPAQELLYEHWGWAQTVDLLVSIAGVYVAIMGIQASTENTLRLARIYLIGTFFVGVGWLLFNYFFTVEINESIEADHEKNHPSDDYVPELSNHDIYMQALSVMVLPAMVWVMCCLRAAQFHHLLREAEVEAENRIRSELERSSNNSNNNNDTASVTAHTENDTAAADRDSSDPESGIEDGPDLEQQQARTRRSSRRANNNRRSTTHPHHRVATSEVDEPVLT